MSYGKIESIGDFTIVEIIQGMAHQIRQISSNESIWCGSNQPESKQWIELKDIDAICEDLQARGLFADDALSFIANHRESGYITEAAAIDLQLEMEWIRDLLGAGERPMEGELPCGVTPIVSEGPACTKES